MNIETLTSEEVASSCSTWVNAFGDMFFGDEENTINNP